MRTGLFVFAFIILLLPAAQQLTGIVKSAELKGGFRPAADTTLTLAAWMNGSYQQQKEKYLNDAVGFRADLVRLNNQLDYSLLDKCHAGWIIKGRDGHLFQYPYVNAYYGIDYIGYDRTLARSLKLRALQDTLARMGKSLVVVYAASKASFYPEFFPANRVQARTTTNHDAYRRACDSLGVNQVDLDAWFVSMKGRSREPLFSKQGIHWTKYGAVLAGDSLMRYMEILRHMDLPMPDWSHMEYALAKEGDDDLASQLNLIFPVAVERLAYPVIRAVPDSGRRKLNAIYIGDSYAHKMTEFGMVWHVNDQCEFWSYFDEMHDINGKKFTYIKDYDWVGAMLRADAVLLVYTSFNLGNMGNGFIEQAYEHFYGKE